MHESGSVPTAIVPDEQPSRWSRANEGKPVSSLSFLFLPCLRISSVVDVWQIMCIDLHQCTFVLTCAVDSKLSCVETFWYLSYVYFVLPYVNRHFENRDVFYSNFGSSKCAEIYKVIYPVDKEIDLSSFSIVAT